MQSSLVAVLAVLATGVCAGPLNPLFGRATCDVKNCVVALAPSFPTACDPAAAQLGANTPFNTACLAAAAKGTAAFPTSCAPCAAQFGVTDPGNKTPGTTKRWRDSECNRIPMALIRMPRLHRARTLMVPPGMALLRTVQPRTPGLLRVRTVKRLPSLPLHPHALHLHLHRRHRFPPLLRKESPLAVRTRLRPPLLPPRQRQRQGLQLPPHRRRSRTAKPLLRLVPVPAFAISRPVLSPSSRRSLYARRPVMQLGANTSFNGNCLVAAAKDTAPFPTACGGCAAQFGVTEPGSNTNTNANTQSPAPVGGAVRA
ncbi:hypothetical protein B0H14DRAFT_3852935 [Mycena olivaceomarginata]|nr:hypothetical protein B0H14DRAFT_3852935 [Mycena olivaceomarginata]